MPVLLFYCLNYNRLAYIRNHQYGKTKYGQQTGDAVDPHWNYFLPARNWFGFVYSYGHGVLLRTQALITVGGFPEVLSEDIALSTRLREAGYQGYYAYDIESFEEVPPSYQAFRRKNQKVISGTLDFLFRFYPSFLRATNVSLVEKLDLLIALSVIYLPIPFMCFLFVLYGVMPLLNGGSDARTAFLIGDTSVQHFRNTMEIFGPLQNWDSVAFIFFTVFAPLCYLVPNAIRSPQKVILHVLRMGTIYLSICLHTVEVALKWFVTRRASFIPTGDRLHQASVSFNAYVEYSLGLGMIIVGALMGAFCLMAVGLSLTLVPILIRKNLDGPVTSLLVIFPILMTIAAIFQMPASLVGVTGMFAGVALAHH